MESANECSSSSSQNSERNEEEHLNVESAESVDSSSLSAAEVASSINDLDLSADEKEKEEEELRENLREGIRHNDAAFVQQAIEDGADVNFVSDSNEHTASFTSPLMEASQRGFNEIVRILLDAGANARWKNSDGFSAIGTACENGHLSTVEMLFNHDNGLLEIAWDPLIYTVHEYRVDIIHFLLTRGANAFATERRGFTTLMRVCSDHNRELVRVMLAAGVDLEARSENHYTALHVAAHGGRSVALVRELIFEHNADLFAADRKGYTPFDFALDLGTDGSGNVVVSFLLEVYGNKLAQEHGRLAAHAILGAAEYSFTEHYVFHPPLKPLQIRLPLGKLRLYDFRTLLHSLDVEVIRNRDGSGKLPIHIACEANAPVEVLAILVEMNYATLQLADNKGALPIHLLCDSGTTPTEFASVKYLVEQGGVGTLAARNHEGSLPLHIACGSKRPALRIVQYLIQSFPGAVISRTTNDGQYPFMIAAVESSAASLSVVFEIVRANPNLIVPSKE